MCVYQVSYFFTFKEKKGIRGKKGGGVHSWGYIHRVGVGGSDLKFQGKGKGYRGGGGNIQNISNDSFI